MTNHCSGEKAFQNFVSFFFFSITGVTTGFHLMTHDSYFTILIEVFMNHISAENSNFRYHIERTEHKIMILKPANKYQIIQRCHNFKNILIDNFQYHPFLYQTELTIKTFIYCLIYSGAREVFRELMQHMFLRKFDFSFSIKMYHFEGLLECVTQNI